MDSHEWLREMDERNDERLREIDERLREINCFLINNCDFDFRFVAKGTIKLLFPDLNPEYRQRKALGFYNNFSDIHDQSGESWLARKTACTASEYMVALSRKSSKLDDTTSATLSTDFVNVGDNVLSLGLHSDYGLMACRGTIIVRKDDLDSDDLMSSSCIISESGIGGPVVVQQTGILIDDIISSCNDKNLSSPIQLSDLCLKFGKTSPSRERKRKRKHFFLKVVIQRPTTFQSFEKIIKFKDFNHPGINRWPVIPLDVSVDNCVYNSLSFQGGTIPSFTVSTRDLAEILPNDNQELGKADAKFSGFNVGIGVKPPEEDTLINAVDPINAENSSWAPYSGSCNVDLWSLPFSTSVNVRGKSAALDIAVKVKRPMVGGHDPLLLHSPYNMRKPEFLYPNQQINSSSPHLQAPSINYSKTWLHPSDSHPHLDPHMKITPQDAVIHRDAPKIHQFSTNMDRPLHRY
ncbi:hypothetical protein KSS87_010478 [Heliosperma pusillum]|nr:hypothetical protein KSS87_010478 [Heliosperma pusillum]